MCQSVTFIYDILCDFLCDKMPIVLNNIEKYNNIKCQYVTIEICINTQYIYLTIEK